eukprot:10755644-Alexandrium_andersonii.AAC.1
MLPTRSSPSLARSWPPPGEGCRRRGRGQADRPPPRLQHRRPRRGAHVRGRWGAREASRFGGPQDLPELAKVARDLPEAKGDAVEVYADAEDDRAIGAGDLLGEEFASVGRRGAGRSGGPRGAAGQGGLRTPQSGPATLAPSNAVGAAPRRPGHPRRPLE